MPLSAKVNHCVGAYANLGEWSLLLQNGKYSTSFGVEAGVGGLYELQAGPKYGQTHFLFDIGVGAWGGMTSFIQASNQDLTLSGQTDLDGDPFDYVYELRDRQDQYRHLGLSVPIMVGVGVATAFSSAWETVLSEAPVGRAGACGAEDVP